MAEPAILRALFQRIGMTQQVAERLVGDHNINSIAMLAKIKPDTVDRLIKIIRHPGANAAGHEVPFQTQQNLKDVAWLLKHRRRTNRNLDVPGINLPILTEELEIYRDHEEQWTDPDTLGIEVNRKDWTKTFRTLEEAFTNYKGIHGENKEAPANPDPSADYASIKDEIIARAPIVNAQDELVATFKTDNTPLWKLLCELFKDTVNWTDIKHCARSKNSRAAFLALKSARLGVQHTNNVSSEIEKKWSTLSYAGPKCNWKFDNYARTHKECFLKSSTLPST